MGAMGIPRNFPIPRKPMGRGRGTRPASKAKVPGLTWEEQRSSWSDELKKKIAAYHAEKDEQTKQEILLDKTLACLKNLFV
jgi:hypothetical protein